MLLLGMALGLSGWKKEKPWKQDIHLELTSFHKSKKEPIVLHSKAGFVDEKTGEIQAIGQATLCQGGTKISADRMQYNPKTHTISAVGRVKIMNENGTIAECDRITLRLDQETGELSCVRVFSPSQERFTAQSVHHDKNQTILSMGSYTPCSLCSDSLGKPRKNPLWSIHAREIVLNKVLKRMEYTDAHFSVLGTPVAYVPYFYVPTERSSGIVSPDVGTNTALGGYVGIPYFWAISPEQDITWTSYLTTQSGALFSGLYRGHTLAHQTRIQGAIHPSYGQKRDADFFTDRESLGGEPILGATSGAEAPSDQHRKEYTIPDVRGFLHGKTVQNLNEHWRFSGEQWWVSDKTFLETRTFFGQSQSTFLPSHATLERFDDGHYWTFRTLNYQGLQPQDQKRTIPYILPEISYAYQSKPLWKGSTLSLDFQTLSLYRAQGNGMQRIHGGLQWDWSTTTEWGQKLDVFAQTSGTFYALAQQDSVDIQAPISYSTMAQMMPQCGVISRWPWVLSKIGTIGPTLQVLVGTSSLGPMPYNEDSQSLIFDESNLFEHSRFSGYDRFDQGSRMNYGLDWNREFSFGSAHAFLGQSYSFVHPDPLLHIVGIRQGRSDYVGQLDAQWDYGDFIYRFRVDSENGTMKFQELGWQGGPDWAVLSGSYAFGQHNSQDTRASTTHYNQMVLKILSKIGDHWMIKAFTTHDFYTPTHTAKLMDVGVGFGYQNECVVCHFTIQKSYYTMQDMKPGWSIGFSLQLKSMGGFERQDQRFDHGLYPGS